MNEATKTVKPGRESTAELRKNEHILRPSVDIFEDTAGITLRADMPGVSREHLDIQVNRDTLSIQGEAEIPMPEGMEAIYADIRLTRYQRSFSLSSELDGEQAEASLKDGVLTLRIPKHARYQPRKIEVSLS